MVARLWLGRVTAAVVTALERNTVRGAVLAFLFFVTIRTGLEQFSDNVELSAEVLIHFALFDVSLASCLVLLFHAITRVPILETLKVILPAFAVLTIVPIIDLLAPSSGASNLAYFGPGTHDPLAEFFALGTAQGRDGATLGVRVEIVTVMSCAFLYGRHKGLGLVRSALLPLAFYVTTFLHGLLPFVMKWSADQFGLIYLYSDRLAAYHFLLFVPLPLSAIFYLACRKTFVAIVKDLRYLRLAHYLLMMSIGLALGFKNSPQPLTILTVFQILLVPIAVVLAAVFAIVSNNVEDKKIDSLSNPQRPLITGKVDEALYEKVGWFALAGALFYGAMSGFPAFFAILFVTGTYYLYSVPPVRFKRVFILSKLVIAANSLALMMLGFVLAGRGLADFPRPIIAFVLVGFTLVTNFIDLKDYRGDKYGGIPTLPVLVGPSLSKKLIAAAFFLVYLGAFFGFSSAYWLIPLVLVAALQAVLINRREYREAPVFGLYLASLVVFFVYVALYAPDTLVQDLTWERILDHGSRIALLAR
jgi:4-hydroxybenzoate polyprenyltransferase